MKTRILTALVLLCIFVPVLIFSGHIIPIATAVVCVGAIFELLRACGLHRSVAVSIPFYLLAVLMPLSTYLLREGFAADIRKPDRALLFLSYAVALLLTLLYLFAVAVFYRNRKAYSDFASVYMFGAYVLLGLTSLCILRYFNNGAYYYLLIFIGAWTTDTFAYFTGFFLGKHKLIPEISPKKTVEGSIGGILGCALSFVVWGLIVGAVTDLHVHYGFLIVTGIIVSVISQIGDLIASLLKRERGIKDFSHIFPGHGGILDRFDSILAVSPVLMLLVVAAVILKMPILS